MIPPRWRTAEPKPRAWRQAHGGPAFGRGSRRWKRLQFKLLVWFLGAIFLAFGASAVTTWLTSSDTNDAPTRVFSRHVQQKVQREWDDPAATDRYVAELRETTGLDIRVRRDASIFEHRPRLRANGMVFEDGVVYVPVVKRGTPVGALELHTGTQTPQPWRVLVALGAAIFVLGGVARRVAVRLSRPLEHVAIAAERFGSGDLQARTRIDEVPRRWIAEEVREVGRAFDTMADRIAKVVLEQRELLAAISHELRSPLGRARVALEIARERAEAANDDAARAAAERALADVDRQLVAMDVILGDLLASARAGLADTKRTPTAIAAWLEEKVAAEEGDIALTISTAARDTTLDVDGPLLGRAFHNVLANAWNHGHPRDVPLEVDVFLATSGLRTAVRIAVRDRGPGFAADVLPRAFEPFVTGADPARTPSAHGLGLGLALVRKIVEAHGGTVSARNIVDGANVLGAEVAIELPS